MFRKLTKKLNNFKTTAIIVACISGLAAVFAIFSFFMFHYAGPLGENQQYIREVGFYHNENGGVLSFIVYIGFLGTTICGIMAAYSMVPFIRNKEKLTPKKSPLIVGAVGAAFEILLVVMMILLLMEPEVPYTRVGIIVSIPFGILSAIGQICFLYPYFKCNFYMPEVVRK